MRPRAKREGARPGDATAKVAPPMPLITPRTQGRRLPRLPLLCRDVACSQANSRPRPRVAPRARPQSTIGTRPKEAGRVVPKVGHQITISAVPVSAYPYGTLVGTPLWYQQTGTTHARLAIPTVRAGICPPDAQLERC